jgi:hypothetical protein
MAEAAQKAAALAATSGASETNSLLRFVAGHDMIVMVTAETVFPFPDWRCAPCLPWDAGRVAFLWGCEQAVSDVKPKTTDGRGWRAA